MDYQKTYNSIINNAKSQNRKKGCGIYYENHHIIPRCLGGNDEKPNLVLLTAKEHFICHELLVEIYPKIKGIQLALFMMSVKSDNQGRIFRISSREFEKLRKIHSDAIKGFKHSEESKKKMSESRKGSLNHMYGYKWSEEQKENMSKKNSGENNPNFGKRGSELPWYGKPLSEETKNKISKALSGKNHPFYGKKHSDKTKELISKNHADVNGVKNPNYGNKGDKCCWYGRKHSEESKRKIGKALKGKKKSKEAVEKNRQAQLNQPILTCPYCGKQSRGKSAMLRWHFENCKHKNS